MQTILASTVRGLKTASRNTGTHSLSYEVADDGSVTFEGTNREGKPSIKGSLTAEGKPTVKRLAGAKKPKAAKDGTDSD